MKVSELRQIIREEVRKVIKEIDDKPTVENIMKKVEDTMENHREDLINALTARKRDKEDEDAYYDVENELQAIAKELGLDSSTPFMEDEMFSGSESPKNAYNYAKEMFTDMIEDV